MLMYWPFRLVIDKWRMKLKSPIHTTDRLRFGLWGMEVISASKRPAWTSGFQIITSFLFIRFFNLLKWPPWVICAPTFNNKIKNFCTFQGYWNRSIKGASQVDGKTKDWITKRQLHGPLRHRNSPTDEPVQDGQTMDQVTPWCGPALFPFSFSLPEIVMLKIS